MSGNWLEAIRTSIAVMVVAGTGWAYVDQRLDDMDGDVANLSERIARLETTLASHDESDGHPRLVQSVSDFRVELGKLKIEVGHVGENAVDAKTAAQRNTDLLNQLLNQIATQKMDGSR